MRPLLELQARWSALPAMGEWLVERIRTREGHAWYFYPFEGRLAHLGLATLFSYRLAARHPRTFSLTVTDYGFALLSAEPVDITLGDLGRLLVGERVEEDILAGLNAAELNRRQFREIARVAGLVFQGFPGQGQSARQLQASSGLLHDVFAEYDPDNPLLQQATREVLERQLEASRIDERARAPAGQPRGDDATGTSHTVQLPADGGALPRAAHHRGPGGARGADGRRARGGGDASASSAEKRSRRD